LEVLYETTNPNSLAGDCGCRIFWLEFVSKLSVAIAGACHASQLCLESNQSDDPNHTHDANNTDNSNNADNPDYTNHTNDP
jgi:hypothetical protein